MFLQLPHLPCLHSWGKWRSFTNEVRRVHRRTRTANDTHIISFFSCSRGSLFSEYIKKSVPASEKNQPPLGFFPVISFILMLVHSLHQDCCCCMRQENRNLSPSITQRNKDNVLMNINAVRIQKLCRKHIIRRNIGMFW